MLPGLSRPAYFAPDLFPGPIEHEATNDSDRTRVVLIGDVYPALSDSERLLLREFLSLDDRGGVRAIGPA